MERELVMPSWLREAAAYGGAMESSPSRSRSSSSGCQSGWTLYLDHSNGNGNGMRRYLPCDDPAAAQRWMVLQEDDVDVDDNVEDSMVSDASSGPRPLDQEEEDTRRHFEQRPQGGYISHCSASSGSGGFGGSSTWSSSRSSQGGVRGVVVVHGGEATTTRQYREIVVDDDEEDELDDTASSSSAVSLQSRGHGARQFLQLQKAPSARVTQYIARPCM